MYSLKLREKKRRKWCWRDALYISYLVAIHTTRHSQPIRSMPDVSWGGCAGDGLTCTCTRTSPCRFDATMKFLHVAFFAMNVQTAKFDYYFHKRVNLNGKEANRLKIGFFFRVSLLCWTASKTILFIFSHSNPCFSDRTNRELNGKYFATKSKAFFHGNIFDGSASSFDLLLQQSNGLLIILMFSEMVFLLYHHVVDVSI